VVPRVEEQLSLSSLIVADLMRPLREDESQVDPFAIGTFKVIPNVSARYEQSQQLGLFFEAYGLGLDQSSLEPDAEVEVIFSQGGKKLATIGDDFSRFGNLQGNSVAFTIALPLKSFPEGTIEVDVTVIDHLNGTSRSAKTAFDVVASTTASR